MIVLPAIDLKGGKCVRLRQGRAADMTVYSEDPALQARDWRDQGGQELHVVDLDGAFDGLPRHLEEIKAIIKDMAETNMAYVEEGFMPELVMALKGLSEFEIRQIVNF